MNVMTTTTRLAATGAAAALAAAALVGVTTTSAHADPIVTNTYSCTAAGQTFPVVLASNAPGIEVFLEIGAGTDLSSGLLSVTNTFTIPGPVYDFMTNAGVTTVSAPTFSGDFGSTSIGVDGVSVTLAGMTQNGDGSWSSDSTDQDGDPVEGTGVNSAFEVPTAGQYDILSPATLALVATTASGGEIPVSCTIAEGTTPGAYHSILVFKNDATAEGKPVTRTLKTTKVAKMKVTVAAANQMPTGKVLVKERKKTLGSGMLNDLGKATVKMGKLSKGKHTVKVVYKGDGYTNKVTSEKVTFTVKKP